LFINTLRLTNFRNIDHLKINIDHHINLISGHNGLGKTNLLDALARITTIRGLKNQPSKDCVNVLKPHYGWGVGLEFSDGSIVQYGRTPQHDKTIYHYNHTPISHENLRQKIPVLWLTPVGEKLFTEDHSDIRRYIDYLISLVFPSLHTYRSDYDKALKQRMKLLQDKGDPLWITALEHEIAKNACYISHLRCSFLELFQENYAAIISETSKGFPNFTLNISCQSEKAQTPDHYQNTLMQSRTHDTLSGRSQFGIHRNKIHVLHQEKNIDIYYCSTGEQKAILSHILFIMNDILQSMGLSPPIMLFDDALAHYDQKRIHFFYDYMQHCKDNQFFLTNTYFPDTHTDQAQFACYPLESLLEQDCLLF